MARAIKRSRHNATRNEEEHVNRRHFIDLPLDMLFEIFLLLEPAELLYLARTTKGLRAFLLDRKKASALWNNAISSVGLPPCPCWMSPPAYVFLAFDPLCHVCHIIPMLQRGVWANGLRGLGVLLYLRNYSMGPADAMLLNLLPKDVRSTLYSN
ncbi:hypothetical protein JVU11DRAFT_877 [Chiua virens]|nr:hypothetical protein JVU11DRAFT_877 [Chiua virens]